MGRAQSLIDYSVHLLRNFRVEQNPTTTSSDLSTHLKSFPLSATDVSSTRRSLDQSGTQLWNFCRKTEWNQSEAVQGECLAKMKVLAFFMLESAQDQDHTPNSFNARTGRVGLSTAKFCLYCDFPDLVLRVLDRLAGFVQIILPSDSQADQREPPEYLDFGLQYLCLRVNLDQLDLAEYFYSKVPQNLTKHATEATEDLVDLLFDIGKSLLDKKCTESAVLWLARANEMLSVRNLHQMSPDAGELRLNVLHTYARALFDSPRQGSRSHGNEILSILLKDYGGRVVVRLLQLDIISKQETPEAESFYAGLSVICTAGIHLSEENFCMFVEPTLRGLLLMFFRVMHLIHKMRQYSFRACDAIGIFLFQRLIPHTEQGYIERAFVTCVWMATTQTPDTLSSSVDVLFNKICDAETANLSSEATHGVLVLLWKRIETHFDRGEYNLASDWCKLGLHRLLYRRGDVNTDKLDRKLVQCYLEMSEFNECRKHLNSLSERRASDPLTNYLAYCLALKTADQDAAQRALLGLRNRGSEAENFLFACVSKTLEDNGSPQQAAHVLLELLEAYSFNPPSSVNLPALLRCAIRLYTSLLTSDPKADEAKIQTIAMLFKKALDAASIQSDKIKQGLSRDAPYEFTRTEVEWLVNWCYNLAVEKAGVWSASVIICLFRTVIGFLHLVLDGFEDQQLETLSHFALSILSMSEARRESDPDVQICHLRRVISSVQRFGVLCQNLNDGKKSPDLDLVGKYHTLLPLLFEATLLETSSYDYLETYLVSLRDIISQARKISAPKKTYALIADIILSHTDNTTALDRPAPGSFSIQTSITLLAQIITSLRATPTPDEDLTTPSRWIRCLFTLALSSAQSALSHPLSVVSPIPSPDPLSPITMITDLTQQTCLLTADDPNTYPAEELEFLAASLFNLSVDLFLHARRSFAGGDAADFGDGENRAREVAGLAVRVADILGRDTKGDGDGGRLARLLRERAGRGMGLWEL